MRPKQWTKNLLVFAGYLFTIQNGHNLHSLEKVIAAFGLFCAVSGVTYIFNDSADVEKDRKHPKKCKRPIASGAVSVPVAVTFATVLLICAIYCSFRLDFDFGLAISGYFILTSAYSALLKHIAIVDLLALSAGFVIRAVAGALVIDVKISSWLLACTTLLALFLGLAKRRSELVSLEEGSEAHRSTLGDYSAPMLDQMLNIAASSALMTYILYTFTGDTGSQHPLMMLTIPCVVFGLFRYILLIHNKNAGGSPELVLLEDKPTLINIVIYVIVTAAALLY